MKQDGSILVRCSSVTWSENALTVGMSDIKPDNILVNYGKGLLRFSTVQLGDCGHSCRDTPIESTDSHQRPRNRHTIGAALYRSPEAMLNLPWDTSTDIWSFGVTVSERSQLYFIKYP